MSEGATDSSPDVYVRQLREIFLACDSSGSGLLNRDDLQRLCRRLNLESEINKRITDSLCVAGDDRRRCVGFDEFKETFINVLTQSEHKATNDGDNVTSSGSGHQRSGGLENAIDLSEEERHLLGIWKELGVGANGNLNLGELHKVCQFLNMGHMTNKDVEQLFAKLDVDGDGFVSFGELLHGLFEIGEMSHADEDELPAKRNVFPAIDDKRMMSLPLQHSYDQRRLGAAHSTHAPLHAHEGILAFLKKEGSGFAKAETIVELWESVGIKEGHLILKLLRFDVKKSISLLDLSLSLIDEIHAIEVDNNIVYEAALSTVEHALDYLHSVNEDVKLERNRLISDLSAMKKRNAAIVDEFDELYNSTETKKTQDQQLASVEIATKYQQVVTQLKQESDDCEQLRSNLNATKEEVASLVEKLRLTNKAKDALELELSHMSEKCWSLEKELEERDLEQMDLDNRLQHQQQQHHQQQAKAMERSSAVVNDDHELELEHLMRGMSVERKDIEGAFRLEIAELEERHLDQLNALKKEFEKEKDDLVSGHKRHLTEAVAERERDLLTEFAKEMTTAAAPQQNSFTDSTQFQQMQERLRLAQETAEEKSRYANELETKLFALQEEKRNERRIPDAVKRQQQLKDEDEDEEGMGSSSSRRDEERRVMEKLNEEKQKMTEKFNEDLASICQQHKQDLTKLNNDLTQSFHLASDKAEASFVDERRKLEKKITSMENDLLKMEEEKERNKKELEKELHTKDLERELYRKDFEEQLQLRELEKEQHIIRLERELMEKEEEIELFKKELEKQLHEKELEKDVYKTELEQELRITIELLKNELEKQLHEKELEKDLYKTDLERDLRIQEEQSLFKNELGKQLHEKELEKDAYRIKLERDLRKKEEEKELLRNELEERLHKKELEKDLYRTELEKEWRKKEEEQERQKKELEDELTRKDGENEMLRSEIEKLKQLNDEIELEKKTLKKKEEEEVSHERTAEGYLKLQVDELRRNNARLKDSLETRDGELLRLRQEMERDHRQLKRDHLTTGSGDHQLMTNSVAMSNLRDVLVERDLLKKQLQLTVNQLSEATSTLSLVSEELKKEKEMTTKVRGQMVERSRYDDVIVRLRDAHANVHHLQHDYDFRAAETTKLLSLSQTVNKQRLNHLMDENEKLETQMKQRKTLIKDQLMKITKQADELVKSDALIRDLYIENAHLIRCLQKTEGNRQDSDMKVQVLHQKCIDLGRLLNTVGPLAFNHH